MPITSTDLHTLQCAIRELLFYARHGISQHAELTEGADADADADAVMDGESQNGIRPEMEREQSHLRDAAKTIAALTTQPIEVPGKDAARWTFALRRAARRVFLYANSERCAFRNGERVEPPQEVTKAAAWLKRSLEYLAATPSTDKPADPRTRGPKRRYDPLNDQQIADEWQRARDAGTSKKKFAHDNGMTVKDLNRRLNRVRRRKNYTDQ